jgi:hypothetical protein
MEIAMKFAKWVYRIAGIYGLLVLAPLLFLEHVVSQTSPPAITHPEYYYGFAITGVAWQVAFIVISSDPQRFRPLMPVTWLEKSWGLIAIVLYIANRISLQVLALGLIDLLLAAFFVSAYITITQSRVRVIGGPDEPATRAPSRAGQR